MARRLTALVAALLLSVTPAVAGHLLLSANDGKYPIIDGVYKVADPPAPDTLTILDVRSFPPRAIAEIEVHHTGTSPPGAVALTPDEKLALVSAPSRVDPNDKTKLVLEDALQVVDLEASPPRVIARVPLGSHPLGLSVSRAGDLALVAHVTDGTVSVLTISGKTVTRVGSVKVGDEKSRVSHVAISPDGKWALVSKRGENTVAVLAVDGTKVEYTKRDITTGVQPDGIAISPDGRLAVVGNVGRGSGDADTVTVIDMTLRPIRAVDHVAVGPWAAGVAFSPDGKWLAVAISNGTNLPKSSSFRAEQGRLLLYSVQGMKLVKVAEAPTGRKTRGVTFTPDGQYIYVQNYVEQELAVFRPTATALEDTGTRVKVKGHPASIRVAP
jgi:DNA-binding beta-propeller fold protein YncE